MTSLSHPAAYELAFTEADLPTIDGELPLEQGGAFNEATLEAQKGSDEERAEFLELFNMN